MDDYTNRFMEICFENQKLKNTIVKQICETRKLFDEIIEMRKKMSEISKFCPLAIGNYEYLFDDSEIYYD